MRLLENADDSLTVTHNDTGWTMWCLYGAIAFAAYGLFNYLKTPADTEKAIGCLGATTVFGCIFLAAYERSVFTFDRRNRLVEWNRRRVFSRRQGTLPFDKVKSIVAQTPIGDSGTPSRRVALLTEEGEIPISIAYCPDSDDQCLQIAASLNALVGRPSRDPLMDSVRGLVESGRIMDAIRLLRQERNMSLAEAHDAIARLRKGYNA